MSDQNAREQSPLGREHVLWEASRHYIRGEITADQLKTLEDAPSSSNIYKLLQQFLAEKRTGTRE